MPANPLPANPLSANPETTQPFDATLVTLNRAEMPKSVFFSLALEHPDVRQRVLHHLGIETPASDFQCTSLFHPIRDLTAHCQKTGQDRPFPEDADLPLREFDVLLAGRGLLVAFEFKWNARTTGLLAQLHEQRIILDALKTRYGVKEVRLVLVCATHAEQFGADHVLTFQTLAEIIRSSFASAQDPLHRRIVAEFDQLAATGLPPTRDWQTRNWRSISLAELIGLDGTSDIFVGYGAGLTDLRQKTADQITRRPFWNVAEGANPNPAKWFSLAPVLEVIHTILGAPNPHPCPAS